MLVFNPPILVYHRIVPPATALKNLGDFAIPQRYFERQMCYLHEHGYVCLPLADLFRQSDNKRLRRKKGFALTFDDGHEDFYTYAYPILRKYGFSATVFVVTDWIQGQNDLYPDKELKFLTWEQIKILQQNGISFGSHSCSHLKLPDLSHDEVWHELNASKESLEARLGHEIQWLAYPYGASSTEIQSMAEAAGYKAAFGVSIGRRSRFNVWRRQCLKNDNDLTFAFKLNPLYHFHGFIREETIIGQYYRKVKNIIGF